MPILKVTTAFSIKQRVYLETDAEQLERIITAIIIYPGEVKYRVSCSDDYVDCYDFELRPDKNLLYGAEKAT